MDKISKSDLISFIGFLRERDITIVPYTQTYFLSLMAVALGIAQTQFVT